PFDSYAPPGSLPHREVKEAPGTLLARIRQQSCYKTLRALVNLLALFIAALGALSIVISILIFAQLPGSQSAVLELWTIHWRVTFLAAWAYLMGGLFLLAVAIAARQAALLLVDIADMLIDRSRNLWRFSDADQSQK